MSQYREALYTLFEQELKHSSEAVLIRDLINLLADVMKYETNHKVREVITARLNAIANDATVTVDDIWPHSTRHTTHD